MGNSGRAFKLISKFFGLPILFTIIGVVTLLGFDFSHSLVTTEEELLDSQFEHIEYIAKEPHPVGSEYHGQVNKYIRDEIDATEQFELVEQETSGSGNGIDITNIFAFKRSNQSNGTVVIVAHYDSEVGSYGANDDGLAVASMLSIMQKYDLIDLNKNLLLFFSDAEEQNLAGARSFVSKVNSFDFGEIESVYNFEARGAFGPIYLFESVNSSTRQTMDVASRIGEANNHSITQEIYKQLPNNSDLSALKDLGVPGYNFGYFRGLYAYHSSEDNVGNTSLETREQQLSIMDEIVKEFALTHNTEQQLYTRVDEPLVRTIYFSPFTQVNLSVSYLLLSIVTIISYVGFTRLYFGRIKKQIFKLDLKTLREFGLGIAVTILALFVLTFVLKFNGFFNYFEALLLVTLYLFSLTTAVDYLIKTRLRFYLELVFYTLGLLSLAFLHYFYLFILVTLVTLFVQIFTVRFQRYQKFISVAGVVIINILYLPFVWELVWLYDNRSITLIVLLATIGFLATANVLVTRNIKIKP